MSGLAQSIGGYYASKETAKIYNQQADIARKNATQIDASAQLAARQEDKKASQLMGSAIANAAGSGASVNSVSAVNNLTGIAEQGKMNSLMTLYNGQVESTDMRNQANALNAQASATRRAGRTGLLTGILGAAADMGMAYGASKLSGNNTTTTARRKTRRG